MEYWIRYHKFRILTERMVQSDGDESASGSKVLPKGFAGKHADFGHVGHSLWRMHH